MLRQAVNLSSMHLQRLVSAAARAYVSGPELSDALNTSQRLARLGLSGTVCYWNVADDIPADIAKACVAVLTAAQRQQSIGCLAVKLSPLGFDEDLLNSILFAAAGSGTLIHFDSHGPEHAEQTLLTIEKATSVYPNLGCTLPGRWRRSLADVERAVAYRLHVRVVKGQWADVDTPEIDARAGYLDVIDRLAGRARQVAVATHDVDLARDALQRLRAAGTDCLLELLYGLPMKPQLKLARELDVAVRVYIPFGYGCLPYCLSQVRRHPWMLWWLLRDAMSGGGAIPQPALRH